MNDTKLCDVSQRKIVKMPLSAAERCRRYREKLKQTNPQKYEEMKKKNAERTKAKKRKVQDMDENEKEEMRKKWRDAKRKQKEPKEDEPALMEEKSRRRYRSQITRENRKLKEKHQNLFLRNNSLKKIILRLRKKINFLTQQVNYLTDQLTMTKPQPTSQQKSADQENNLTPMAKSLNFIEKELPLVSEEAKEQVKRKILQQNVLEESLKEIYRDTNSFKERKVLKKIVESKTAKKYKMQRTIRKCLGLKSNIRQYWTTKEKQKRMETSRAIKAFFERDDVSRMTAGKKECLTLNKIKKQKRWLLNTLPKLYKMYKNEGGNSSFTTFKRYRPFYIVRPNIGDRYTCVCIKHANMAFKVEALKKSGLVSSTDLNDLISETVCDSTSKNCMYSECEVCSGKELSFRITTEGQETVSWFEWTSTNHEYEKSGQVKVIKKIVKEKRSGLVTVLATRIQEDLIQFKKHNYNVYHQYKQYKEAISNQQDNEVIIHCDFSENYVCKMREEVQSMHFGASKGQITLHAVVAYIKNNKPLSFCSISPSLKHGPEAIWAHLKPVLGHVKENFPMIDRVHFFSDGPTTQYRQKNNFLLFNDKTKQAGFAEATWSFFESYHGKGAADGVGGAVKRSLDRRVTYGDDITNAKSAFEALLKTDTTVKTFYVSEQDIEDFKITSPQKILPVPSTMKLHQVIATNDKNVIKYRHLSCFCSRGNCDCFGTKVHVLQKKEEESTKKKVKAKKMTHKRETEYESSSENTDTEIQYVDESDFDSNCIDWIEDISTDEDNSQTNNQVKANEQNKNLQEKNKTNKAKVTILSDIKNTKENQAYFDLKKMSPNTLTAIGLDFNLSSAKSDINKPQKDSVVASAEPIPSSSGIQKRVRNDMKRSTNYCVAIPTDKETETDELKNSMNETLEIGKENIYIEFESVPNMLCTEKTSKENSEYLKIIREQKKVNEDNNPCTDPDSSEGEEIAVNDAVLARYYIRKKWKYYVGFIMKIGEIEYVKLYTVKFLKTVTKPELKFIMTKKNDIDSITEISIVKKLKLFQHHPSSKEYYLKEASDQIYF